MVRGDLPRQHPFGTNYLEVYWPCAGGLSAANTIGTQLRDPINSGLTRWLMTVEYIKMDAAAELARNPVSATFCLSVEMSGLTRDETAGIISRDEIMRRERGRGNIRFPCSADHEQDCQPYPVDPYSCYSICLTMHIFPPQIFNMTYVCLGFEIESQSDNLRGFSPILRRNSEYFFL